MVRRIVEERKHGDARRGRAKRPRYANAERRAAQAFIVYAKKSRRNSESIQGPGPRLPVKINKGARFPPPDRGFGRYFRVLSFIFRFLWEGSNVTVGHGGPPYDQRIRNRQYYNLYIDEL